MGNSECKTGREVWKVKMFAKREAFKDQLKAGIVSGRQGGEGFPHEGKWGHAAYWLWKSIIVMSHLSSWEISSYWHHKASKDHRKSLRAEREPSHICVYELTDKPLLKWQGSRGKSPYHWTTHPTKGWKKTTYKCLCEWLQDSEHNAIISSTDCIKANHWNGKKF